jgi:hypothetical protein
MMNLLEKAGLVRKEDEPGEQGEQGGYAAMAPPAQDAPETPPPRDATNAPVAPVAESTAMSLDDVYAAAGVPASPYPAERLMRLMDGLKEMTEEMRLTTIRAIDAADDSWTIDDPLRDARAKIAAIDQHLGTIRAGIAQEESASNANAEQVRQRQDGSVADIRRQIADLEGLLSREIARGAQELAGIESALRASKEGANREIDGLTRAAGALQGLISHFNTTNPSQGRA